MVAFKAAINTASARKMNAVIEFVETIVKQVKFFLSGDFGSAITIPAGRYAVFSITGELDAQQQLAALRKLWQEL